MTTAVRLVLRFLKLTSALAMLLFWADQSLAFDLALIDRSIAKLPAFKSKDPLYALLVFGPEASKRVWLIRDGEELYVDRNGNGDLTETDECIAINEKESNQNAGLVSFHVGDIVDGDHVHQQLKVTWLGVDHLREMREFKSLLADKSDFRACMIVVDVEMPGYQGTGVDGRVSQAAMVRDANGLLQFAEKPELAPIIHFGGPWEIAFSGTEQWNIGQRHAVHLSVGTPGLGPGSTCMIAYDKVIPPGLFPELKIVFPSSASGESRSPSTSTLTERCCVFSLFGDVQVPDDCIPGTAKVEVSLAGWPGTLIASTTHEATILPALPRPKLEEISPRLLNRLPHSNSEANLVCIGFSPDGKQLIAGDYPGGIIHVWDIASRQRQLTVQADAGYRPSQDYFVVSPDWKKLYTPTNKKGRMEKQEQDGKIVAVAHYFDFIQEHDLKSGALARRLEQTPANRINNIELSPDGSLLLSNDGLPGVASTKSERGIIAWGTATGSYQRVGSNHSHASQFSKDGRWFAASDSLDDDPLYTESIRIYRSSDLAEHRLITVPERLSNNHYSTFALNDTVILAIVTTYSTADDRQNAKTELRFWKIDTGESLFKVSADKGEVMGHLTVSPDSQTVAVTLQQENFGPQRLILVDAVSHKTTYYTPNKDRAFLGKPSFHNDGTWLALPVQILPKGNPREIVSTPVAALPQPSIDCVDTATGKVIESLTVPQSWILSTAFSPDGTTLASGGHGELLLWDVRTLRSE